MRCPNCARLMDVSFITTLGQERVWRCSTAGVPVYTRDRRGNERQTGMTADHSDHYYVEGEGGEGSVRVSPLHLGYDEVKNPVTGQKEKYHHWGFQLRAPI